MPSSTRRARERASTRDRIIEAALLVLETEGAAALTIRRIAADVDYTAPIVYQHFANKDALILELVGHGYDLMLTGARRVVAEEADPDRRLLRIAADYMRFAGEHPHLYEAMNGAVIDAGQRREAARPAIDLLLELLTTWSDAHGAALADRAGACEIIWATFVRHSVTG
jgi:AcrR family transcriptional regulator